MIFKTVSSDLDTTIKAFRPLASWPSVTIWYMVPLVQMYQYHLRIDISRNLGHFEEQDELSKEICNEGVIWIQKWSEHLIKLLKVVDTDKHKLTTHILTVRTNYLYNNHKSTPSLGLIPLFLLYRQKHVRWPSMWNHCNGRNIPLQHYYCTEVWDIVLIWPVDWNLSLLNQGHWMHITCLSVGLVNVNDSRETRVLLVK